MCYDGLAAESLRSLPFLFGGQAFGISTGVLDIVIPAFAMGYEYIALFIMQF